jgi:hypothetical protein
MPCKYLSYNDSFKENNFLLSKTLKVTKKNNNLLVVLCGSESVTSVANKVLRKNFGPKSTDVSRLPELHNEERLLLANSMKLRLIGHVDRRKGTRNTYKIWVEKTTAWK